MKLATLFGLFLSQYVHNIFNGVSNTSVHQILNLHLNLLAGAGNCLDHSGVSQK